MKGKKGFQKGHKLNVGVARNAGTFAPHYEFADGREWLISDEEFRLKLDDLIVDMNTLGTHYGFEEQDLIDEVLEKADKDIKSVMQWNRLRILNFWKEKIGWKQ